MSNSWGQGMAYVHDNTDMLTKLNHMPHLTIFSHGTSARMYNDNALALYLS
jgi:hypothetical protein